MPDAKGKSKQILIWKKDMQENQVKKSYFRYYLLNICALLCFLAPLLPWMSYGVGSKTGVDIGNLPAYIIFSSSFLLFVISHIVFKTDKLKKTILFFGLLASLSLLGVYVYEIIKIAYQTMIAKNLPVEMFGVVSLSTSQIKIGYGLWVGGAASFVATLVTLISIKISMKKTGS